MPRNFPFAVLGIVGWLAGWGIGWVLAWLGGPHLEQPFAIAGAVIGVVLGILGMEEEMRRDILFAALFATLGAGAAWLARLVGGPSYEEQFWPFVIYGAVAGYLVSRLLRWRANRARRKAMEAAGESPEEGFKPNKASYLVYFLVCLPLYGAAAYFLFIRPFS